MTISLYIPCLPNLDLSANRRRSRHYMTQASDTRRERAMARLVLGQVGGYPLSDQPVSLHWTVYWPKGTRARDADSLAAMLKPWQDAMIDLGWIDNDSPRYVPTVCYTSVPSSERGPSMELEITRVEA